MPTPDLPAESAARAGPQAAEAAGLTYVSDASPGIRRLRSARGFRYVGADGRPVRDEQTLARIRRLAIPPAYEKVWICPDPRGHLQASARDARGRKQYRYHAAWRELRDAGKFDRMLEFGRALPRLRRRVGQDLQQPGLPRDKVLAAVVALLDRTRSRVGNAEYARANRSYGLTTLRSRHAESLGNGQICIRYRGKAGQVQELTVDDPQLARVVRRCQQLPGQALFQYVDDDGAVQSIDSGMVNDYLRAVMGADFTAKDFRTFGGTVRALALLAAVALPTRGGERACVTCINDAVKAVARELGNTPAVARKSYIHPEVLTAWRRGELAGLRAARQRGLSAEEALALAFLRRLQARERDIAAQLRASLRRERQRRAAPRRRARRPQRATGQG